MNQYKLAYVLTGRFAVIIVVVLLTTMAAIQLAVALNLELTQPLARKAMWIGSVLWLVMCVTQWVNKSKQPPIPLATIFTVFAAVSVLGFRITALTTAALWVNAGLAIAFCGASLYLLPRLWKQVSSVSV